jgi:glutathione S-transferase
MVEMMNRRVEFGLFGRVASAFRHTHPSMAELEKPQFKDWGAANRDRIGDMLAVLDRGLADHPFMAGDNYSIADITAQVAVDFLRPIKFDRPPGLVHLERWHASIAARPSAKA